MKPERLVYTYVSMAAHYDTVWGHGTPDEGVERTAATAHKYNIPVTWIVNSGSIGILGERIRRWHEEYGDDVILRCPAIPRRSDNPVAQMADLLNSEWAELQAAFPWATTKVAGAGIKDGIAIAALEEAGFEGIWGYCWEQVWWDGITNQGVPWGFWYVDKDRYKIPHPTGGQLVACEWTARDLHQSYHTSSPVIYSTDPNDVLRAGLCTGTDIEYWKRLFQDYLRNTASNEQVYFLQHQEAHEMEVTEAFAVYPFSHVVACDEMQDLFFQYITQYPITITTLPQAIRQYKQRQSETAPCWMLTEDPLIRPELNEYTMTLGGVGLGPWPDTLFYYDKECQLAFIKGDNKPRMLRNYVGKWNMQEEFSEPAPPVFVTHYAKSAESIEIVYEIGHWKPIPYGLAYWDELADYEVEPGEGTAVQAAVIEDKLVFLRFNLTGGKMKIDLKLRRKKEPN
ncbi:MAG: hypothetical protein K0R57_459 [Paenibacillaceae bacterium]|nr:hypothetical protein [Paenibacillaceae bacterium]